MWCVMWKAKGQMELEQLFTQHLYTLPAWLCSLVVLGTNLMSQFGHHGVDTRYVSPKERFSMWRWEFVKVLTKTILPWELFQLLCPQSPLWKFSHWSDSWLARWLIKSISKLLREPWGKSQAAVHFLTPGNTSRAQQTCSSAGLGLMLVLGGAAWGHLCPMEACSSLFNWRWI